MNLDPSFGARKDGLPPFSAPSLQPFAPAQERIDTEFWLAAAFVALSPLNFLRLDAFYFTASDAMAAATLVAMIVNRSLSFRSAGAGTFFWNGGLMLLVGTLLLSSLLFGDPVRGMILFGQYLFAYFLLAHLVFSRPWREIVLLQKVYLLSIGAMCLHGIHVVNIAGERFTRFVSGSGRLQGFVERENECAAVIALAVPLLLFLVVSGQARRRWLWLLPLLTYGILLTGSNTGLLSLTYALGFFVVMAGTWRQIFLAAGSATFLLFAAITWGSGHLPAVFQRRVLGALQTGDIDEAGTFEGRMALIREAIGFTDRTMLLGFGADQYNAVSVFKAPVHNTYLLLWTEAGFIGMVGFLLMLAGAFITAVLAFGRPGGRLAGICTLTSATLLAVLVNAMPHVYGRFFVVPVMLGMAPSILAVRDGALPLGRNRRRVRRFAMRPSYSG